MSKPDEPDLSHYKTTGLGLALVGFINSAIAIYSLIQGTENSFIEYEAMLAFGTSFIMIGYWMRSLD